MNKKKCIGIVIAAVIVLALAVVAVLYSTGALSGVFIMHPLMGGL